VQHDVYNLVVEAMMINRYGMIPSGAWRKGNPLSLEWGETVKVVKRLVKTMNIDPRRLAWYIKKYEIERFNYNEFGLVRYRVNKLFGWMNLEQFTQHYTTVYKSFIKEGSAYVENSQQVYVQKEAGPKRKTLEEILRELENGTEE
jgi:hypothetical protein